MQSVERSENKNKKVDVVKVFHLIDSDLNELIDILLYTNLGRFY